MASHMDFNVSAAHFISDELQITVHLDLDFKFKNLLTFEKYLVTYSMYVCMYVHYSVCVCMCLCVLEDEEHDLRF